ncbi:hypothetical protein F4083_04365 [Candidatus Poribacteria bacterium]|nr:hypothetical protein [Candidatus Poribacteria bacterium]MYI93544.1 hypothetical protein [Candidatus Poribacteria bacterium]
MGEEKIATALTNVSSMPQSTNVFANPVLHKAAVNCGETQITLNIRSFGIRGVVTESEIIANRLSPAYVIFAGLFGRKPEEDSNSIDEEAVLSDLIDKKFYRITELRREGLSGNQRIINQIAEFVKSFPDAGPEAVIQHFSTLRKLSIPHQKGVKGTRKPGALLMELISTHMENVALGTISVYMRHQLRESSALHPQVLAMRANDLIVQHKKDEKTAFQTCYSLLLGREATSVEAHILERMGVIQTHHGSAGSNVVARYLATLYAGAVSDFFVASQMALDGDRHFGAIHDMTAFINEIEPVGTEARETAIRDRMRTALPTFGHPMIAAAGRSDEIQQDPRPAIYFNPFIEAVEKGEIQLNDRQKERLAIMQRLYQIAFVEGIVRPGREDEPPLRLTPNTDFGGWAVQEGLDIYESDRTFLTYIFRGFGWIMDAREQLQLKIIRPVIPPDPEIIPKPSDDLTISNEVVALHNKMAGTGIFD